MSKPALKYRIGDIRGELTHVTHTLGWLADWKAEDPNTANELRKCAREVSAQLSRLTELALELEAK